MSWGSLVRITGDGKVRWGKHAIGPCDCVGLFMSRDRAKLMLELKQIRIERLGFRPPVEFLDQGCRRHTRNVQPSCPCLRSDVIRNGNVHPRHAHIEHHFRPGVGGWIAKATQPICLPCLHGGQGRSGGRSVAGWSQHGGASWRDDRTADGTPFVCGSPGPHPSGTSRIHRSAPTARS